MWQMNRIMASMSLLCLARSHLSDPGVIPRGLEEPKSFQNPLFCRVCNGWKPPRAHHSRLLNRCVFRMDHVCRWIGNVVGYSNQKFFIQLLVYTSMFCLLTAGICIMSILEQSSFVTIIEGGRLLLFAVSIFAFFIIKSYLSEQVESLDSNVTLIETFKNCEPSNDRIDAFRQIFGNNPLLWFLPIYSSLPPDYSERIVSSSPLSHADAHDLDVDVTEVTKASMQYPPNKKID